MKDDSTTESFFRESDIVSCYTRAQAIEDGVLADVTDVAAEHGFTVPVAIASNAWAAIMKEDPAGDTHEALRIVDVLRVTRQAVHETRDSSTVEYDYRGNTLFVHIGPGDNAEPVITIMAGDDL